MGEVAAASRNLGSQKDPGLCAVLAREKTIARAVPCGKTSGDSI
jgi:hypothetical protein